MFLLCGGRTREETLTSCLPKRIVPSAGVINPAIVRNSVVFPQPDGPRIAANSEIQLSENLTIIEVDSEISNL